VPAELAFPVVVGVDLVDEHRALFAPMPGQVALSVTVDVEPPCGSGTLDRVLPHAGVHGAALPGHIARQTNIDREQRSDAGAGLVRSAFGNGLDGRSDAHRFVPAVAI